MIRISTLCVLIFLLNVAAKAQQPGYVNLEIIRGLTTDRHFLSANGDGSVVDLWRADESGRQKWILEPHSGPRGNYYNIIVQGDVNGPRRYLSTNGDGSTVDLWSADDGSGRQQWIIERDANDPDIAVIRIAGGVSGNRFYLSCSADGGKVDLWTQDDGSGRQRWHIKQQAPVVVQTVPAGLPTNVHTNFTATRGGTIEYMVFRYDDQVSYIGNGSLWPGAKIYVFPQQVRDVSTSRISFDPTNPAIGGKTFTVRTVTPTLAFTEKFPMMRNESNDNFMLVVEVFR